MQTELSELLQTAMYKEVASQAFYTAGQDRTEDPSAKELMKELAEEESRHLEMLKWLNEQDWRDSDWDGQKIPNLMISEYLTGGDKPEGASFQDTLVFAMKRELQAVEFYSRMMGILRDKDAKRLCERLVHEELKHKLRLEMFYDDLSYGESWRR